MHISFIRNADLCSESLSPNSTSSQTVSFVFINNGVFQSYSFFRSGTSCSTTIEASKNPSCLLQRVHDQFLVTSLFVLRNKILCNLGQVKEYSISFYSLDTRHNFTRASLRLDLHHYLQCIDKKFSLIFSYCKLASACKELVIC